MTKRFRRLSLLRRSKNNNGMVGILLSHDVMIDHVPREISVGLAIGIKVALMEVVKWSSSSWSEGNSQ
jgi:hypothetical protein